MFAAATREVVFSNPNVVRRVNAAFIPVALKAATVANPPPGPEGDLYRLIKQTRPAPQGICTLNSTGCVLAWALSFQQEDSILHFLDHVATRYQSAPNQPIYAERFRKFPSVKLPDIPAPPRQPVLPARHGHDETCIGAPSVSAGGLIGSVIGRRLDESGQHVQDTRRQENYMEARVELTREFQKQIVGLAMKAGSETFKLPDAVCRAIVGPAHLGQLDVNPLGLRPETNDNRVRKWQFSGTRQEAKSEDELVIRIEGTSHVAGGHVEQPNGPTWDHTVKLDWQGFVVIDGQTLKRLCLSARGSEQLSWGNQNLKRTKEPEVEHLMAGHSIDFKSGVEYGLLVERTEETK